ANQCERLRAVRQMRPRERRRDVFALAGMLAGNGSVLQERRAFQLERRQCESHLLHLPEVLDATAQKRMFSQALADLNSAVRSLRRARVDRARAERLMLFRLARRARRRRDGGHRRRPVSETAKHWIDGEWRSSASGATAPSVNPGTGETLGEFADAGPDDAEAAIAAARRVFDTGTWARQPRLRAQVLLALAERIEAVKPELAWDLARENGKPIRDAMHEVAGAVSELRYYAGLARNVFGRTIELEPNLHTLLRREPVGVVAIIVPWNAPIALLIRSLAPVIAAGCTAVVKAAPQTALGNGKVFERIAGVEELPRGAVIMLVETGDAVGKLLVASPDVDMLSYTGSTEVGKKIMAASAATLKRLNLELGGSAPCVVFDDADLDRAAEGIVRAALSHAGQVCVAASRVIVHRRVAEALEAKLLARLRDVRLGLADDPATELGPLIDLPSRDRIGRLVSGAKVADEVLLEGRPA